MTRKPTEILADISNLRIGDANEASTRFKLIDEILFGALGWTKDDVEVEERVAEDGKTGYADYFCKTAQTSILIEAKRISIEFKDLPETRRASLKGSWIKGAVGEVIRQAREYGRKRGVGFCVATNGDAWIIFPVNRRDSVSFEESACIIFPNATSSLDNDWEEFASYLSREAVIDGSLEKSLLGSEKDQFDARRLNQIFDRTFSKSNRGSVFSQIEQEIVTAFSEDLIADHPDLLERSYVTTPDRARFDSRIKMYLLKRDQVFNSRPIRPIGKGGLVEVSSRLQSVRINARPIAILTLGLVGSGKTTFLHYTSKISAKELFTYKKSEPTAHWIYIDFRNYSAELSARNYIVSHIFDYISAHPFLSDYERCVKFAYQSEIENLKRGPLAPIEDKARVKELISEAILSDYKQKEPYVLKVISYAAKNAPIFLVVDNVDQIEGLDAQASIFLESLTIARTVSANLVLAMRDATYLRNKTSPIFDAFDFDKIYIDPPDIQSVLSKRFVIAEQLLRGKTFEFAAEGNAKVIVRNAQIIIEMLSFSVLGTEVGRILEIAATGDTRLALQMTRQFLQYGYGSSVRHVAVYQRTKKYRLPPHEALRAIMLGNQAIYNDEYSPIGNPFDAKLAKSEAQFLRIFILSAFVASAGDRSFNGLEAGEVISKLEKIGFSQRTTEAVLKDLIDKRFLFSRSHQPYNREAVLVPSRLGGYMVRELIGTFVFLENVIFDTFISDEARWSNIKNTMRAIYSEHDTIKKFRMRKQVVTEFFDYVEAKVQKLVDEAQRRALPSNWCTNPLTRLRRDFEIEMRRALRSAVRNYGRARDTSVEKLPLFDRATR